MLGSPTADESSSNIDVDNINLDETGKSSKKPVSSHRLKMRSPPSMAFCLVMILSGFFYVFHHRKLHEKGGASMIMSRLEREYTNLGILAALMMAVVFTEAFVMHDVAELYGLNSVEELHQGASWQYTVQLVLLIFSGLGEVLALIFSIINLVTLNLVAQDELLIYLEHATWTIRLPFLMLVYGTLTWVLNVMFYILFITSWMVGVTFNVIIVCCAIFVFFAWGKMMQATYVASQHTELIQLGVDTLPALPGYFRPGGSAAEMELVQQEVKKLDEGDASGHLHEQKLVRRLSSRSKLTASQSKLFAISTD